MSASPLYQRFSSSSQQFLKTGLLGSVLNNPQPSNQADDQDEKKNIQNQDNETDGVSSQTTTQQLDPAVQSQMDQVLNESPIQAPSSTSQNLVSDQSTEDANLTLSDTNGNSQQNNSGDSNSNDAVLEEKPLTDDLLDSSSVEEIDDATKMRLFSEALDEAEQFSPPKEPVVVPTNSSANSSVGNSSSSQPDPSGYAAMTLGLPQAVDQATANIQNQVASSGGSIKERPMQWSLDTATQEVGGGLISVEQEPTPEIAPELESYLQKVEDHAQTPAQSVEALAPAVLAPPLPTQKTTVRVLPITKKQATDGRKKNPSYGIRWLVEWSDKIIQVFKGKAIYRKPAPAVETAKK